MSELKESKIDSKIVYKGSFLDVRKDEVKLPNGNMSTREWIKHPGAVCIIPIFPNGDIALIRQYRYPIKREMIELPAGKLDGIEEPEMCAKRELEEEIGEEIEEAIEEAKRMAKHRIRVYEHDMFHYMEDYETIMGESYNIKYIVVLELQD